MTDREPRITKLSDALMTSVRSPELGTLADVFDRHGFQLRIAGGAVRDMLLELTPGDVDLATTATPEQMLAMFQRENIRVLHKAGEKHGTVACRIADKENFEVTTLRIDVLCDGRRAEVEFTRNWALDAERRDLTVNAMFADLDGTVYDFFNGIDDLEQRRIAFVGDARQRIQEDFLRILRYFRFYGRLARCQNQHEADTLAAISENVFGLADISGERIWSELKKIVAGRYAGSLMRVMYDCRVPEYCGLPSRQHAQLAEFQRIAELTETTSPEPMTRLAALLTDSEQIAALHKRLKVSNAELNLVTFIVNRRVFAKTPLAQQQVIELLKYLGEESLRVHISTWTVPKFPVDGLLLAQSGVKKGPRMRFVLSHLFNLWKDSNYQAEPENLLKHVDDPEIDVEHQGLGLPPGGGAKRNRTGNSR